TAPQDTRAQASTKGMSLMRVASPCRGRPARLLRALVLAAAALLAACHSTSNTPPGTPVITMRGENTSPDFASYVVILDSINLTRSDGVVITTNQVAEEVDLAKISDFAELVEAPAAPSGTYTSATVSLDFTTALVYVYQNGKPVLATVT